MRYHYDSDLPQTKKRLKVTVDLDGEKKLILGDFVRAAASGMARDQEGTKKHFGAEIVGDRGLKKKRGRSGRV